VRSRRREALAQAYLRTGDYDPVDRVVERAFEAGRTSGACAPRSIAMRASTPCSERSAVTRHGSISRRRSRCAKSLEERGWQASGHVALSLCERLAGRRAQAVEHAGRSLAIAREEGLRERFVVAAQDALEQAEALAHD
jgi:hypothetical protein